MIRGLGPLFNFKNSKKLTENGPITDPELKRRMMAIQDSIESQLRFACQIDADAIPTDAQRLSLMRLCPHDDSWTVVRKLVVDSVLVEPGEEGADILIERLPDDTPLTAPVF